jgi:hypothetical protein
MFRKSDQLLGEGESKLAGNEVRVCPMLTLADLSVGASSHMNIKR